MSSKPVLIFVIAFVLFSCSNNGVTPEESIAQFSNLEVGNYWIYEWYELDPSGNETQLPEVDSVIIQTDTLIEGRTFFIKSGTFMGNEVAPTLLFDSANSLFSYPERDLLFTLDINQESTRDFGLGDDPVATGNYALKVGIESIDVPAGNFESRNFEGEIQSLQPDYQYGIRLNSIFYSKNVGLVKEITPFYSTPNELEMRLVRFGKNQ